MLSHPPPVTPNRGLPAAVMALLTRVAWLAAAIAIAFGSAGLVAALDHPPSTGARPELTWAADQALRPLIEAIVSELGPLDRDVESLGNQGRGALAALVAADPDGLDAAILAGQSLVRKIRDAVSALRVRLDELPGRGPGAEARIGPELLARIDQVEDALDSTNGIAEAWAVLTSGGSAAGRLTSLLANHDTHSGEAARHGSQGNWAAALAALDGSDAVLVEARRLRDQLANTADTSTLTQWLNRNAAIDGALRQLYAILISTNGTMTAEARQALDAVQVARAQLPPDTRALVVILSDIARAGLNQAVIRIETARGRLTEAIDGLRRPSFDLPSPPPSTEPVAPTPAGEPAAPPASGGPEVTPPDA